MRNVKISDEAKKYILDKISKVKKDTLIITFEGFG